MPYLECHTENRHKSTSCARNFLHGRRIRLKFNRVLFVLCVTKYKLMHRPPRVQARRISEICGSRPGGQGRSTIPPFSSVLPTAFSSIADSAPRRVRAQVSHVCQAPPPRSRTVTPASRRRLPSPARTATLSCAPGNVVPENPRTARKRDACACGKPECKGRVHTRLWTSGWKLGRQ